FLFCYRSFVLRRLLMTASPWPSVYPTEVNAFLDNSDKIGPTPAFAARSPARGEGAQGVRGGSVASYPLQSDRAVDDLLVDPGIERDIVAGFRLRHEQRVADRDRIE